MSAPPDDDRIRGNVYALLGNLLAAPPDLELLETLRAITIDPRDAAPLAEAWEALATAATDADAGQLREEHDALFIGVGRGEVVPYGSWYLTGFLMERPLAELRADLRALGIERRADVAEPEDNAAALCETMALLLTADAPASLEQQYEFYSRHLEPWLPKFFRDLQQAGSARFYRAVGRLGEQFVDIESQAFRVTVPAAGAATLHQEA